MEWERGPLIGKGSFGSVNLVRTRNNNQSLLPPLVVKSSLLSESKSLRKERLILPLLQGCPQIVRCFGDNVSIEGGQPIYNIFLEYMSGGTIADLIAYLAAHGTCIQAKDVRRYTKSMLLGLHHVHQNGFVHSDIKPSNILVASLTECEVKIADFGLAVRAGFNDGVLRGTAIYMAPELFRWRKYDRSCDVWALGCSVLEMLTGKVRWNSNETISQGFPDIPNVNSSVEGQDFLRRCFVRDPSKRWMVEMLLKHPFVTEKMQVHSNPSPAQDKREGGCFRIRLPVTLSSINKEEEFLILPPIS